MAEEHEHEEVVSGAVLIGASGLEQPLDFGGAKDVASTPMVVGRGGRA